MDLTEVFVEGYRSIRRIRFPVRRLTVLVGGNGVGKTNLYRALFLIHSAANGKFAAEFAAEGGLSSAFWAGELKKHNKARLSLSVRLDELSSNDENTDQLLNPTFSMEVGYPPALAHAAFPMEAEIKTEKLEVQIGPRNLILLERKGRTASARVETGRLQLVEDDLLASESALSHLGMSGSFSEISRMRRVLGQWRFYHNFRTDALSPLRQPAPPVTAPTLDSDGCNLAAVFATLRHIRGDSIDLDAAIEDAFPGAKLIVPLPDRDAGFTLTYPEFPHREFSATELSDGTLQYLALMGALLSYRLPPLLALNEPETSLHPSVLPALGRLIARAAERTQILVVTHSRQLAKSIEDETGISARNVVKNDGATWIEGLSQIGIFSDD